MARSAPPSEEQLKQKLGLDLPVHPVSAVGADESLLLRWYDSEVSPLLERHQSLAEASLRRKIASLSESVATSLESLRLRGGASENLQVEGLAEARRLFDEADEAIRRAAAAVARLVDAPGAGPRADPATRRPGRWGRRTDIIIEG